MWLYPYLTIAVMAGMVAVLVSMLFIDSVRSQLYASLGSAVVVLLAYFVVKAVRGPVADAHERDGVGVAHAIPGS
jgi:GABA permease